MPHTALPHAPHRPRAACQRSPPSLYCQVVRPWYTTRPITVAFAPNPQRLASYVPGSEIGLWIRNQPQIIPGCILGLLDTCENGTSPLGDVCHTAIILSSTNVPHGQHVTRLQADNRSSLPSEIQHEYKRSTIPSWYAERKWIYFACSTAPGAMVNLACSVAPTFRPTGAQGSRRSLRRTICFIHLTYETVSMSIYHICESPPVSIRIVMRPW